MGQGVSQMNQGVGQMGQNQMSQAMNQMGQPVNQMGQGMGQMGQGVNQIVQGGMVPMTSQAGTLGNQGQASGMAGFPNQPSFQQVIYTYIRR